MTSPACYDNLVVLCCHHQRRATLVVAHVQRRPVVHQERNHTDLTRRTRIVDGRQSGTVSLLDARAVFDAETHYASPPRPDPTNIDIPDLGRHEERRLLRVVRAANARSPLQKETNNVVFVARNSLESHRPSTTRA